MRRESELTHPPTETIVDSESGDWFLVYDAASGFEPDTVAIKARTAGLARRVWCDLERNRGADTFRLHADRLDRSR
jgi:hypothetical protein